MATWVEETGATVATSTTAGTFHDGTGSLRVTKSLTVGTGRTIRVNTGLSETLTADNGNALAAWVLVPSGAAGTNWQARLEMQNAASAWQAGSNTALTPGTWAELRYTPTDATWAGNRSIGVQFSCDQASAGSVSVYIDTVRQGTITGALSPAAQWEQATQAAVAAIRGNSDTAVIYVPGYQFSGAQNWVTNHPVPWITDAQGRTIYEAHYYFDRDNSGDYPDTYTAENTDAVGRGFASLTSRAVTELSRFTNWCTANAVAGHVAELGWPNTGDTTNWNAVGEALYDVLDAAGIGSSQWAAGSGYGTSYNLSAYTGSPLSTPTTVADVPESHLANAEAMPVGNLPGWTQVLAENFNTPAALGQVGTVYGTNMRGYDAVNDSSGNGTYTPDRVLTVANSILDWHVHTETVSSVSRPRVAAPIPMGYGGQTYGRFSVRFRSDAIPGYKMAFLLWPASNVWNDGEIDGPESQVLGGPVYGASLKVGSVPTGAVFDPATAVFSPQDTQGWHTFTTEWTPGSVKWFWDGALLSQTIDASKVPAIPMRWTLQVETSLITGPPDPGAAGHVQVDWITAYTYTP